MITTSGSVPRAILLLLLTLPLLTLLLLTLLLLTVLLMAPRLVPMLLQSVMRLATCAGLIVLALLLVAPRGLAPLRILLHVPLTLILPATGLLPLTSLMVLVLRLLSGVLPARFPLTGHLTPLCLRAAISRRLQTPRLFPASTRPVRPRRTRVTDLHQGSVVRVPVGGAAP